MAYEIDFDGEERSFELVPIGEYQVWINSVLEKGEGEGRYLNFMFKVADGPSKGRTLFTNASFKKDAVWKLKNILVAAGIAQQGFKGAVKWANEDLVGKKVGVRVSHEDYNDAKREAVNTIFALKGDAAAKVDVAAPAMASKRL